MFVGFVGRFVPLVRWKKGCVFFSRKTSAMDDGLNFNTLINDD